MHLICIQLTENESASQISLLEVGIKSAIVKKVKIHKD